MKFKFFFFFIIFSKQLINYINKNFWIPKFINQTKIWNYKFFDYLVSERPILTLTDFKNPDVEYFLKKYKRNKPFSYDDRKGIKDFIISTFNSFNKGKLGNIKCDYSDLRYDRLAKKYRDIIES